MNISPDNIVFWQWQWINLNATIVYTWLVMAILVVGSWLITRKLSVQPPISRWQTTLEIIIEQIQGQIRDASGQDSEQLLPFIGTLFLFIACLRISCRFSFYHYCLSFMGFCSSTSLWHKKYRSRELSEALPSTDSFNVAL